MLNMSRYKGRQNTKAVERDFPHFVDVVVPPGGLGKKLNRMYEFHTRRGIEPQRGQGRHDANGAVVVAYLTPHPTLASRVASIEEVPSCRCPPHQFPYSRLVSTRSRRSSTRPRPMPKRSRSTLRCFSTRASSPTCLH